MRRRLGLQGWHERNGGNLTYRIRPEEVEQCRPYIKATPGQWVNMGVQADNLRGEFFIWPPAAASISATCPWPPRTTSALLEINEAGDAWRIVWGLEKGGRPTSEFPSHFLNHSVRKEATGRGVPCHLPRPSRQPHRHDLHFAPDGPGLHPRLVEERHRVPGGVPRRRGRGALDGPRRQRTSPWPPAS